MTYGQGEPVDDPGMFPDANLRYQDRGGDFDHPGLADAILDRVLHSAHKLTLAGESLRKPEKEAKP